MTLLTATMADKDVDGIVRALAAAQAMRGGRVICTQVALSRALDADALAARWRALASDVTVTSIHDPRAALREALSSGATASGPVIVAGSLYLVGDVRARLVDDPLLREPAPEQAP
jgi:folylpolyglutamate synthase/dihydropteroate synthase